MRRHCLLGASSSHLKIRADPIGIPNKNRPRVFVPHFFLCKKNPWVLYTSNKKIPQKNQHHQQVAKIQVFWEDKKNPPKFAMKKNVDFKEDRGQGLAKVLITRPLPYTYCLNFPEFPLKKTVFFYSGHIQFTICFFCCTLRRNSVRKRRPGT